MADTGSERDNSPSIYFELLEEAVSAYNEKWSGIGGSRYDTDIIENGNRIVVEFYGEKLEGESFSLEYSLADTNDTGEKAVLHQGDFPRMKFENILDDLNSILIDRIEGSFDIVKDKKDDKRINEYYF